MDVGYDLIVGDWVEPHGTGKKSDFIFHASRELESRISYKAALKIKFANHGDGILDIPAEHNVGSALRVPHHAPEEGYLSEVEHTDRCEPKPLKRIRTFHRDNNYFFRVRSQHGNEGLISAMYGKIYGGIEFDVHPQLGREDDGMAVLMFAYYINPAGTTNTEFDPKRNLFGKEIGRFRLSDP